MTEELPPVNTLVYGRAMTERLTKSDWIRHGLRTLANEGLGALKVGPMAEGLKVSRGSFYWHFRDIADFRQQLLESWETRTTEQVAQELAEEVAGPDRLRSLLKRVDVKRSADQAVRTWAAEDPTVARIVARVDARRVAYIAELLADAGVEGPLALSRATFIYWALLGQGVVMDPRHAAITELALDDVSRLFQT